MRLAEAKDSDRSRQALLDVLEGPEIGIDMNVETGDGAFDLRSMLVDRAVRRQVFALIVKEIKERNADADPDKLAELIEEAVEQTRARRS